MAVRTVRCIFDADLLWIDKGDRALAAGESAQVLNNSQIQPGAVVGSGWWDAANGKIQSGFRPVADRSELQGAALDTHDHLNKTAAQAEALAGAFPAAVNAKMHDVILFARQAFYLIASNEVKNLNQAASHRVLVLQRIAANPTGAASTRAIMAAAASASYVAPSAPSVWVNPQSGVRSALANASGIAGDVPADLDVLGASWIADL